MRFSLRVFTILRLVSGRECRDSPPGKMKIWFSGEGCLFYDLSVLNHGRGHPLYLVTAKKEFVACTLPLSVCTVKKAATLNRAGSMSTDMVPFRKCPLWFPFLGGPSTILEFSETRKKYARGRRQSWMNPRKRQGTDFSILYPSVTGMKVSLKSS